MSEIIKSFYILDVLRLSNRISAHHHLSNVRPSLPFAKNTVPEKLHVDTLLPTYAHLCFLANQIVFSNSILYGLYGAFHLHHIQL